MPVQLNLDALEAATNGNAPPEEGIRLCIDFGTAMSKICAVGEWDEDVIPLRLGRDSWGVPSSLYIGAGGEIRFGAAAEEQHLQDMETGDGRARFDNIKGMLSSGDTREDLFHVPLPVNVDPTGKLTKGDALLLYLAWLTDRGCEALGEHFENGSRRYIRRRFAVPCFANEEGEDNTGPRREEWAKGILKEALLYAQVVADTLMGRWSELTVEGVLPILRRCRKEVDVTQLQALFAKQPAVREPLAAGASPFVEQIGQGQFSQRQRLLVIDAGAGTTDVALFQVSSRQPQDDEDVMRFSVVWPSIRMSRDAGNKVDEILMRIIQDKHQSVLFGMNERKRDLEINTLYARIRDIKLQLFEDKKAEFPIGSLIGSISINEIEMDGEYRAIGERMKKLRRKVFEDSILDKNTVEGPHKYQPVHVLLTGGSSVLPIFQDLACGNEEVHGWDIQFGSVDIEERQDFEGQHHRLAVAIGGAARQCHEEMRGHRELIMPKGPPGSLPRY